MIQGNKNFPQKWVIHSVVIEELQVDLGEAKQAIVHSRNVQRHCPARSQAVVYVMELPAHLIFSSNKLHTFFGIESIIHWQTS